MSAFAKFCLAFGALAGMTGVVLGAFGAHALRSRLTPEMLAVYQTAVQYQFWHALALVGVGLLLFHLPAAATLRWSGVLFAAGILLFSGSLYLLAITGMRALGVITPIGGAMWIVAWALLGWSVCRA